jgi:hypothetical protein
MTLLLSRMADGGVTLQSVTVSANPPNVTQGATANLTVTVVAQYDAVLQYQLDNAQASFSDTYTWDIGTATCTTAPADSASETLQFDSTGTFTVKVTVTRTISYEDGTTASATKDGTTSITVHPAGVNKPDYVLISNQNTWYPMVLEMGSGSVSFSAQAYWNGPDGQKGTADDVGLTANYTWSQNPSNLGSLSSTSGASVTFAAGSILQNGTVTVTVDDTNPAVSTSESIYLFDGPPCVAIDLDDDNWYFGGTITLGWTQTYPSDSITGVSFQITKPDGSQTDQLAYVDSTGKQDKDIQVNLDQYGWYYFECWLWGFHWVNSKPTSFDPWSSSSPHHSPNGTQGPGKGAGQAGKALTIKIYIAPELNDCDKEALKNIFTNMLGSENNAPNPVVQIVNAPFPENSTSSNEFNIYPLPTTAGSGDELGNATKGSKHLELGTKGQFKTLYEDGRYQGYSQQRIPLAMAFTAAHEIVHCLIKTWYSAGHDDDSLNLMVSNMRTVVIGGTAVRDMLNTGNVPAATAAHKDKIMKKLGYK